jgi:hypothetical protein
MVRLAVGRAPEPIRAAVDAWCDACPAAVGRAVGREFSFEIEMMRGRLTCAA